MPTTLHRSCCKTLSGTCDITLAYVQIANYVVSYANKNIEERPEQTVAFLGQLMSTNAVNVGPGVLNPAVTPEGLVRFAPEVSSKLTEILNQKRDWAAARDTLNSIDVFTVCQQREDRNNVINIFCRMILPTFHTYPYSRLSSTSFHASPSPLTKSSNQFCNLLTN